MLRTITARDFAIIDHAELPLGAGMTALTGETGAGKSLMVDALLLVAGARADTAMIRAGCERAELTAEFDLAGEDTLRAWLAEMELDDGDQCRLRRVLRADGSSRAFVNDRPVTLATLKQAAEQLVEIHGQHEHQALLSRGRQLSMVDALAGHGELLARVSACADRAAQFSAEIETLRQRAGDGGQAAEFLRFQVEELARHALAPEAIDELEREHARLAHAGELLDGSAHALDALDGDHDHAINPAVGQLAQELARLAERDPALAPIAALLGDARVALDEARDSLARWREAQDLDPERLGKLDRQLARLHDLARKHRIGIRELKAREAQLRADHEALADADTRLARLEGEHRKAVDAWRREAAELSASRQRTASALAEHVTALMQELGMGGGRFEIAIETRADAVPSRLGADTVEFLVSANPGQPPRALRKVASGGELARISLAIEVAALGRGDVGTMVFDEVDSGIGGAIAEVVGRKLRELGGARQVLCVTHLPQVAAQAREQVAVHKVASDTSTRTVLRVLDAAQRIEEIARMLGGVDISTETRALAREMLARTESADANRRGRAGRR
jgi:DNA repair protein RecN (Recombination protein N)